MWRCNNCNSTNVSVSDTFDVVKLRELAHCHDCGQTGVVMIDFDQVDETPTTPHPNAERVVRDAAGLSSGTLAGLIGDNRYAAIEQAQANFVTWCTAHPTFGTWVEAWQAYSAA